jgi:uncharacterized protein YacL
MTAHFTVRLLVAATLASLAWVIIDALPSRPTHVDVLTAAIIFLLAFILLPIVFARQFDQVDRLLTDTPIEDIFIGLLGLGLGLIIVALLAFPLSHLPYPSGSWLPVVALVVVTPLCVRVVMSRRADVRTLVTQRGQASAVLDDDDAQSGNRVLLDTSAIIDGRIADITSTGFIHGDLVVPRFVLDELQHIADSPDVLRRNRGRRGLDMLNRMSKDGDSPVVVMDVDADEVAEVDGKLVQIAKQLHCPIITNDFNLNRVAELQGVRVLNINQLANAVKPVVLPGEEMAVHIIQQGKEYNQGVGYLDDGTMIVVEDGQRYINRDVDIIVTRVLQTVAGRMIFAHPKAQGNGR